MTSPTTKLSLLLNEDYTEEERKWAAASQKYTCTKPLEPTMALGPGPHPGLVWPDTFAFQRRTRAAEQLEGRTVRPSSARSGSSAWAEQYTRMAPLSEEAIRGIQDVARRIQEGMTRPGRATDYIIIDSITSTLPQRQVIAVHDELVPEEPRDT